MNKLLTIFSFLLLATCNPPSDKKSDSQDEVYQFLAELYSSIADLPEVDFYLKGTKWIAEKLFEDEVLGALKS